VGALPDARYDTPAFAVQDLRDDGGKVIVKIVNEFAYRFRFAQDTLANDFQNIAFIFQQFVVTLKDILRVQK
ncbi:MAG: hypothetical protein K2I68_08265, partial [Bacteroidales bacterium]|nr:hypothetical protein [Bacteroidales bacterium]